MTCTRCDNSGFLNLHQLEQSKLEELDEIGPEAWLDNYLGLIESDMNDVQVCDCCGDGDGWYGTPGEHYNSYDPRGQDGPYAYNGGLCECH